MALNYSNYNNQNTMQSDNLFDSNNNFGQNVQRPYVKGMTTFMPQPMAGSLTQDDLYPLQSSLQTPQLNTPVNTPNVQSFAHGGEVKKSRRKSKKESFQEFINPYPSLAEMIRQQGGEEDTVLAHINPMEAEMLGVLANGGRINEVTGLPQFGLFDNPKKWFAGSVGPIGGAIIGNILLPGIGGVIGGALGGAGGSAIRGRKDYGQAALRGVSLGAALPSAAGMLGAGATKIGASSVGNYLSEYGAKNAVLKSLGMGNPLDSLLGGKEGVAAGENIPGNMSGNIPKAEKSWYDKWLQPKNALTALSVAGSFMNRPKKEKEKSGKELALRQKEYDQTMQLTPHERAMREADMLSERQMLRRIDRNQYLPEERFSLKPTYRKVNSPAEYDKSKSWLKYYDNPDYQGTPLRMKKGGMVPDMFIEEEEYNYPSGDGHYFKGHTRGQDDLIEAKLSDGEFVIPADVVAHAGDGNNEAGAKHFDKLIKSIRKSKGSKSNLPPKIKPLTHYMR